MFVEIVNSFEVNRKAKGMSIEIQHERRTAKGFKLFFTKVITVWAVWQCLSEGECEFYANKFLKKLEGVESNII